jgi:ABC-2 type transport system ATP-binding protein
MIMGLDAPDAGQVTVNHRPYAKLGWPLREVGALLEAKAFHPGRSAANHLRALAQTNDIPRSRVDEVLDIVGLTNVAHKRAGTFSTGMGQRLGIAAALLGDPGVLLFDEPVNGLDPDGILWVRNLFKSLAAEGRTIFVSSHLMSEMALTADYVVVIGRGRLIAEAPVADFVAQSSKAFVRVRTPKVADLGRVLAEAGADVAAEEDGALAVRGLAEADIGELAARSQLVLHELSPQSASLEEAFMELTAEAVEYGGNGKAVASNGSGTDAGQLVPAGK